MNKSYGISLEKDFSVIYRSMKRLLPASIILIFFLCLFTRADKSIYATTEGVYAQMKRIIEVLNVINQYYVEDVDIDRLVSGAINGMLEELDPHSVYIEPNRLEKVTETFDGYFFGIGIEFIIQNKILTVVAPIAGTPAERMGIRSGDNIIKIGDEYTYGISEDEVKQKLRGPLNTSVRVTVKRQGSNQPFEITILRGRIPIYSVMTTLMLDRQTGYILLARFSKTTSDEIDDALSKLKSRGMRRLILDIRNNSGGYLDQAVAVVDKFFDGGKNVVSTKGRVDEVNEEFITTYKRNYLKMPLIILINNGSASAAEIVAGAIQDWDRGLIVGEKSFGKGLVQSQIELKDQSAIRLTIARYFTPSGRLIQRNYDKGLADYYLNLDESTQSAVPESTSNANNELYWTHGGRKVYGGGGIQPDVTIKGKSITPFTSKLLSKRMFFEFGSRYASKHRDLARNFYKFKRRFLVDKAVLDEFRSFISAADITIEEEALLKDYDSVCTLLKSEIARNLWDSQKYYEIYINNDQQVQQALKLFPEAAQLAGLRHNER
ncbi:S41 family peptidase [candidate division KSB1 bacterium]|nr:S41 family peptidase [candidate division KSB1 bacterium]